jgi:hypothetical protein
MHKKSQGSLGEISIAKDLMEKGFDIFLPVGENTKVDLIGVFQNKTYKFQVKSLKILHGRVSLKAIKRGKNYTGKKYASRYTEEMIDIFAGYVYERNLVFYVKCSDTTDKDGLSIRIDKAKNNMSKGVHRIEDYTLEKIITKLN